jgi:hypothetical protein
MMQDREEGELSSEEGEVAEMRETREDLEEGEVDEGEHAAGYGQAHHSGQLCFCLLAFACGNE